MSETVKLPKSAITKYSIGGVLSAALLGILGYLANGQVDYSQRLTAVEVRQEDTRNRLERIETKLDKALAK